MEFFIRNTKIFDAWLLLTLTRLKRFIFFSERHSNQIPLTLVLHSVATKPPIILLILVMNKRHYINCTFFTIIGRYYYQLHYKIGLQVKVQCWQVWNSFSEDKWILKHLNICRSSEQSKRALFQNNSNKLSSYHSEIYSIIQAIGQPINISWGSHF